MNFNHNANFINARPDFGNSERDENDAELNMDSLKIIKIQPTKNFIKMLNHE